MMMSILISCDEAERVQIGDNFQSPTRLTKESRLCVMQHHVIHFWEWLGARERIFEFRLFLHVNSQGDGRALRLRKRLISRCLTTAATPDSLCEGLVV